MFFPCWDSMYAFAFAFAFACSFTNSDKYAIHILNAR